jgi:hypothetical protein
MVPTYHLMNSATVSVFDLVYNLQLFLHVAMDVVNDSPQSMPCPAAKAV